MATWCSGNVRIFISTNTLPKEVVDAYLKLYPSDLPKDMKSDRLEWAKNELAQQVKAMKARLENPDELLAKSPPPQVADAVQELRRNFIMKWKRKDFIKKAVELLKEHVIGERAQEDKDADWTLDFEAYRKGLFEYNKRIYEEIKEWAKNADKELSWNKAEQRFEIKADK
jgi:hypothetical protein